MKKVLMLLVLCMLFCFVTANAEEGKGLTRSEFCTQAYTIVKQTGCMDNVEITKSFEDCDDKAVNEMYTMGVVFGREEGKFCPNEAITRQEAVAIYGRLCKYANLPVMLSEFTYADDADIADWAKDDVYIAYHGGLLGDSESVNPYAEITAEETDEISKSFYSACTGETYPPKVYR